MSFIKFAKEALGLRAKGLKKAELMQESLHNHKICGRGWGLRAKSLGRRNYTTRFPYQDEFPNTLDIKKRFYIIDYV